MLSSRGKLISRSIAPDRAENADEAALIEDAEADANTALGWLLTHYKLLPTDKRARSLSDRAIVYLYYLNQFREGAWYCSICRKLADDSFCRSCGGERPGRKAAVGNCVTCYAPIYEGDTYCARCGSGEWIAGADDTFDEWLKIFQADPEEGRRALEIELAEAGVEFTPTVPEAAVIMAARSVAEGTTGEAEPTPVDLPLDEELTKGDLHYILRAGE